MATQFIQIGTGHGGGGGGLAPWIYALDTSAGPKLGGENGRGTYLTLYLLNAGDYADYGVTNFVSIGGVNVHGYCCLEPVRAPHMAAIGLMRLTVQIGSDLVQALTDGVAYAVSVTVNGVSPSNAVSSGAYTTSTGKLLVYKVNSAPIVFVDTTLGNNAAAGSIAAPLQDLQTTAGTGGAFKINTSQNATNGIAPGTHVIARGRTSSRNGQNSRGVNLNRITGRIGLPIVLQSYPGPVGMNAPELFHWQGNSGAGGFINGNDTARAAEVTTSFGGGTGWCQYMEFSNLKATVNAGTGADGGPFNTQNHAQFMRITNCEMSWPSTVSGTNHGKSAGIEGSPVDSFFALNYIHDIYGDSAKENHGIYMDGFGGSGECAAIRNEIAGNYIADITHGTGIQFYGGSSNSDMYLNDVHDNFINRTGKYALNWNVAVRNGRSWNNIFASVGEHSLVYDTTSLTSGNTIYNANNIHYGWGLSNSSRYGIYKNSSIGGTVRHENCIFMQTPGHSANSYGSYTDNAGGGAVQLVKNQWYDPSARFGKPAADTGDYGDPLFTAAVTGDFTLQNGSPCIDSGNVPTGITRLFGMGLNAAPAGLAHDRGCFERAV